VQDTNTLRVSLAGVGPCLQQQVHKVCPMSLHCSSQWCLGALPSMWRGPIPQAVGHCAESLLALLRQTVLLEHGLCQFEEIAGGCFPH